MRADEYLFPRDLSVNETTIRRVLITGSCLANTYHNYLGRNGIESDYVASNGFLKPAEPPRPMSDYDFEVIQLALREVVTDRVIAFSRFAGEAHRSAIIDDAELGLRHRLTAYLKRSRQHGTLTFVCNFIVPQVPVAASLVQAGSEQDFGTLVRRLNTIVREVVADHPNAYVSDLDAIASSIGKKNMHDDVVHFYSHNSSWSSHVQIFDSSPDFNAPPGGRIEAVPSADALYGLKEDEFIGAVWRQWITLHRVVNQVDQVKLVIFDLDDTLWRGQIAEHYGDGAWPVSHGWPLGLWETVHHLKARGILTAICSKNEESIVRERWSRAVMADWLSLDDFTFVAINWRPKAENVAAIIREASLTPKSVVFVDDNPVERAAVTSAMPDIRVLGANPYVVRRILLWSAETQVTRLTNESLTRESMIRQQQKREQEKASLSRDEFLAGLHCRVAMGVVTSPESERYGRALELINKTNQFNTTGKRWTSTEMVSHFQDGGKIYVFSVEDKFTKYGLVGAILYRNGAFIQFAMSCRVLGLEIETSVLSSVMDAESLREFSAEVVHTDANIVCRDIYERCGFERVASEPGRFVSRAPHRVARARHLAITGLPKPRQRSLWSFVGRPW